MVLLLALTAFSPVGPFTATAQVPQQSIYPGLSGQALIDALRADYAPAQTLGYDVARDSMYRYLDTERGVLVGVYGGYSVDIPEGEDPSSYAYQGGAGISAEHTWPQSRGAGDEPQKSDMHALFPAKQSINATRSNNPFADINDADTDGWYFEDQSQSNTPTTNIDAWSESDGAFPGNSTYSGRFEPREDHKGNAARAMFYYYVIHNTSITDPAFFDAQRETLIDWHNQDQVDGNESDRNLWIASKQGTENPFIADTTLVRRIFETTSGPTVQFVASSATVGEADGSVTLTVELQKADGTAVSAEVAFRDGSSTADANDFGGYAATTVSFASSAADGTTQTVSVPVTDDTAPEPDETGRFALQNVSGGSVGAPGTTDITIADDDGTPSDLLISQYAEDGNVKGLELWNAGSSEIDFASTPLVVNRYANGGTSATAEFSRSTGTLAAGDVLVIADDGANAVWTTLGIDYAPATLQFNGNDAIEVVLGGQTADVLGVIGSDPGTAWTGSGVSTAGQNIALQPGITGPDADGWSDPSLRFATMARAALDDGVGGDLDAFGYAPGEAPCPAPAAQPTGLSLSAASTFIEGTFTGTSGADSYLVVRSTGGSLSADPSDGTTYASGDLLGGGTVVQSGTATSFSATGLATGTTYSTFVYSSRSTSRIDGACTGGPVYLAAGPLTGSATTTESASGTALLVEPFDDATQYAFGPGESDVRDGTTNYFTRTDGSAINKSYDGVVGSFFAGQDLDDPDVLGSSAPGTLTWSSIDIGNMVNLQLSVLVGEQLDDSGDIDEPDYLLFEARVDGGSWQPVLAFENDGSTYNTEFLEDTDFDGTGDGRSITSAAGTMVSFTKSIPETGSTLDLRFTAAVDSGDEDFAIDELRITGETTFATGSDGDIIITEVMQNPDDLSDADGEYVEVYNTTGADIDMDGWTIRDDDIDSHAIDGTVMVPAGGYALFCKTLSAATGCSYAFGGDIAVANGADEIELVDPAGTVVDRIAYDGGPTWPDPTGAAMVFTGTAADDTNDGSLWIEATTRQASFGLASGSDLGSPGIRGVDQRLDVVQTAGDVAGWRLRAAPVPGLTVQWLLDSGAHVQGITQQNPSADANVYLRYNGPQDATDSAYWQPATDATDALDPGWGFIWNPFGMNLPTTFRTTGASTLPGGDVTVSDIPTDEQWHLLGNPFPNPTRVDGLNLGAQSFSTTLQVWDPSAATYRTLTQGTGADPLAPMAGAWVQRTAPTGSSSSLTFPANSQSVQGAPFYKSAPTDTPGYVRLTLTGYNASGEVVTVDEAATVLLRGEAAEGRDVHDADKLTPIAADYATIAFDGPTGDVDALRAVASYAWPQDRRDVPFDVVTGGRPNIDTYRLTWPEVEVPASYEVSLIDRATGALVDLRTNAQYQMSATGEAVTAGGAHTTAAGAKSVVPATDDGFAHGSAGLAYPAAERLRRLTPSMNAAGTTAAAKSTSGSARFVLVVSTYPLPVEMANFSARADGRAAVLEWSTMSEQGNQGFHVEQKTGNGSFRDIGFVAGAGTTNEPQRYTYRTDALDYGTSTFRLRQVDADGTERLTRTVDLEIRPSDPIVLTPPSPHPVTGTAHVTLAVKQTADVSVHLYDILGRRVQVLHDGPVQADGDVRITLNGGSLPSGVYFIRATGAGASTTQRVTVVR